MGGVTLNKHFILLVQYTSGECAFPTDMDDLTEALEEFKGELKQSFSESVLSDKTFTLPQIVSAKIVKIYYRK